MLSGIWSFLLIEELKGIGVEVWFEKENIETMYGDGELMLAVLSSFHEKKVRM